MSRQAALQIELNAIAARQVKLEDISACLQRMQRALEHLKDGEKTQAENIYAKANAVYLMLLNSHQRDDAQNTLCIHNNNDLH